MHNDALIGESDYLQAWRNNGRNPIGLNPAISAEADAVKKVRAAVSTPALVIQDGRRKEK